jgi:hypothetical protein
MKKIFLFSTIVISLFSCKKDGAEDVPQPQNPTNAVGTILDSLIYSSTPNFSDDTDIYKYTYDSQGRVVRILHTYLYSGIYDFNDSTIYLYNGADKLPYKINTYQDNTSPILPDVSTFTKYDSNGRLIYDSCYKYANGILYPSYASSYIVHKYEYSNPLRPTMFQYSGNFNNQLINDDGRSTVYYNISKNIDSIVDIYPGNQIATWRVNSYDNKVNILNTLNCYTPTLRPYRIYSYSFIFDVDDVFDFNTKNNCTSYELIQDGTTLSGPNAITKVNEDRVVTYNINNMPSLINITFKEVTYNNTRTEKAYKKYTYK